jgi:AraC family ethanolamine operon transcriptional activator
MSHVSRAEGLAPDQLPISVVVLKGIMDDEANKLDLTPKIFRFNDIDHFRSSVRSLNVDFTPLVRNISAEQVILNLPGCAINQTKSFPRITDAQLAPDCTMIALTIDEGIPIRLNGVERDRSVVAFGTDAAEYTTVERGERTYASIAFSPAITNRGWPRTAGNFNLVETSPLAQQRLRQLVAHVLAIAPQLSDAADPAAAAFAIRESLLAGVDAVFSDVIPTKWATYANSTRQFRIFHDVQAVLATSLAGPIYSEELARQVGVSVRSVHDAVLRYHGMSLHRYLRLRRLWLVRKRLLEGGADNVKASALAFGFWHLGDFSASYRLQFGEAPSETLARARRP